MPGLAQYLMENLGTTSLMNSEEKAKSAKNEDKIYPKMITFFFSLNIPSQTVIKCKKTTET